MSVTILQLGRSRRLTRREHVVRELGGGAVDNAYVDELIDSATAAIERYTHRHEGFGRDRLRELVRGYGGTELQLARTAVVAVESVTRDGDAVLGWSLQSADEGVLYRAEGWDWTFGGVAGIGRRGRGMSGVPQRGTEQPVYAVTCVAGYILPEEHLEGVTTLAADASDNSFRDTVGGLPPLVRAGDVIRTSGFAQASNNGRFVVSSVSGTGASMRIVVAATLATEAAGGSRSMLFEAPVDCRSAADLDRACVETVKAAYLRRGQAADVVEQQIGATRVRRSEADDVAMLGLPPVAVGLLAPWVRRA